MIAFFISCLILGLFIGFLAGLFGIGGGLIIAAPRCLSLPKWWVYLLSI